MNTRTGRGEPGLGWAVAEAVLAMLALAAIIVTLLGGGLYVLARLVTGLFDG